MRLGSLEMRRTRGGASPLSPGEGKITEEESRRARMEIFAFTRRALQDKYFRAARLMKRRENFTGGMNNGGFQEWCYFIFVNPASIVEKKRPSRFVKGAFSNVQ